jgi:CheY-like chemotaxis protein
VNRHRGKIEVKSEPGKGTEFTVKFPKTHRKYTEKDRSLQSSPRGARVLVVEDKGYLHDIFRLFASREDFRATITRSPIEGLDMLKKKKNFDIVITDMGMPEMNGYQFAGQAREIDPNLSIILTSGWSSELEHGNIERCGIDCVLEKPFTLDRLREVLSVAYNNRKTRIREKA